MEYEAGLHILCELRCGNDSLLKKSDPFRTFINLQTSALALSQVGEAYHEFAGGGYTAVICLTESHISIHTWPEFGLATFDVFLSNFKRNNDATTRKLFELVREFFGAEVHNYHEIKR